MYLRLYYVYERMHLRRMSEYVMMQEVVLDEATDVLRERRAKLVGEAL